MTLPIHANHLLARLPAETLTQLRPSLDPVALHYKEVLQEVDTPLTHVYFPLNGVTSILVPVEEVPVEDATFVEVATVGNEGMVGISAFLGGDAISIRTIVQVPGNAVRMPVAALHEALDTLAPLRDVMQRYTQALFVLTAQTAACNRAHSIAQRCARWLLMTRDRVGEDQFPLTQEFLADMLGVRRAGVNAVAGQLQRDGLIRYQRGIITILDRTGLLARACPCYKIVQDEFARSIGAPDGQSPG